LWQIRNQVVHEGQTWLPAQQLDYMWLTCMRQLNAIARRKRLRAPTKIQGMQFQLSLDCFADIGLEANPMDTLPQPAAWVKQTEPALITRLRTYQAAIN
ncbi:hypothetical protein PHYSODRAFT_524971, partial [Phytophthora sojae]